MTQKQELAEYVAVASATQTSPQAMPAGAMLSGAELTE